MTCPSVVRVAKPEDHQDVWRLLLQAFRENAQFTLSAEKVEFFVQRALNPRMIPEWDTGPRPVIGVIGDVGKLEALAFVAIGSFWYTNDRHIEEYVVFVDPECRQSFHARALIEWMKIQSDKTGLPLLTGVISNERTEAKVRLYRRMVPPIGAFFLYRSVTPSSAAHMAA